MTTLQKYLPCPFCGKQQTLQVISGQELMGEDQEFWQHSESFGVVCDASKPDGKGGCGAMGGFKPTEDEAIEAWNTRSALSQQELPQKERTDFMAGYDAGMADAKRMAQQGGQQPVAYITDTWQGPMVWTPEMYNDACTYCDDGEFPVPLYTAAPAPQAHPEVDGGEFVNGVWRGVAAPQPVVNQQMTTVKESLTHQSAQPVAPLTDDQIKSMWAQYCGYPGGILDFARAVREVK